MILERRPDNISDALASNPTAELMSVGVNNKQPTADYVNSEDETEATNLKQLGIIQRLDNNSFQPTRGGVGKNINSSQEANLNLGSSSSQSSSEDDDESMSSVTSLSSSANGSDDDLSTAASFKCRGSRRRLELAGVNNGGVRTMVGGENGVGSTDTDGGAYNSGGGAAAGGATAGAASSTTSTGNVVPSGGDVEGIVKGGDGGGGGETNSESSVLVNDAVDVSTQVIREVWAHNLYEEFLTISQLVGSYPFVAMDTEFPGIVAKPEVGSYTTNEEYKYQLVKANVDMLKLIQLGLTLFDKEGNRPGGICTWQFNFKFNLGEDAFSSDSIGLLVKSGIQFEEHKVNGINPFEFAELLLSSGLVLMDNITWITFHSAYDFGYILNQLTCSELPETEELFMEDLKLYFPNLYDIKYLLTTTDGIPINGGLQKIADDLNIQRIGSQHQAGSDSLLTGQVFFKMYEQYFREVGLDDVKYNGQICGFGGAAPQNGTTPGHPRRRNDHPASGDFGSPCVTRHPMQYGSPHREPPH